MEQLHSREHFCGLINERDYRSVVEVGVRYGNYACIILDNCPKVNLVAIDTWEPNPENFDPDGSYASCKHAFLKYGDRARMVKAYSPGIAGVFEDGSLDFVYIDALHDYESVLADIKAWWPKVRVGGILAGHDFSHDWPGVMRAVKEVFDDFYLTKAEGRDDKQPSWWVEKCQN